MFLPILDENRNMDVKTTLDISAPLLREVRKIAIRDRTTLRAFVEQGLRKIVPSRKAHVHFGCAK
jgi:hypothetical protein